MGDRAAARAVAFVLCVLLTAGGFAAGGAALFDINNTLNKSDYSQERGFYGTWSTITQGDLYTGKPYAETWYFQVDAFHDIYMLSDLYAVYGNGIDERLSNYTPSLRDTLWPDIYYNLADRLSESGYNPTDSDDNDKNLIYYESNGSDTADGGASAIAFDARKLYDERFLDLANGGVKNFYDTGVQEAFEEVYAD
ncbi:MAG: hypothetical protein LBC58_03835, partial [Clostridiales Family XIII bacterium]|nr:hypothetical protein [Clostridiales Family XIII bacterium]